MNELHENLKENIKWSKANTNIALVKYWGKRDKSLFLPMNSSISITLDGFYTETGVAINNQINQDIFLLDGRVQEGKVFQRVQSYLDKLRSIFKIDVYFYVESNNYVPISSGFASSASAFAALSASVTKAIGASLTDKELSILARQGSGSASRSIYGGFVMWNKGIKEDGSDSYSQQLRKEGSWKLSVLSAIVDKAIKPISSTLGMDYTLNTSPMYKSWLDSVDDDLFYMEEAIKNKDLELLGTITESNALKMHATMITTQPSIRYWTGGSLDVMACVEGIRRDGIMAYFTIDAGANVKIITDSENERYVKERLEQLDLVKEVCISHPGSGISYFERK